MTPRTRLVVAVVGVLAVGWIAWGAAARTYFTPRAAVREDVDTLRAQMTKVGRALDDAPRVEAELRGFADRTLGADAQTVDHRLRTRLNRLVEIVALEKPAVGTGAASPKRSPARNAFSRRGAWKTMRDEIDFYELDGWVSGEGSLETVIALVDRIEAEPWLKRIDQLRVDPKDDGERFAVNVRLTTLFLPGRAPAGAGPGPEYDSARFARLEPLVDENPFRVVRPAAAQAPPAEPVPDPGPPAPPPFPWSAWLLAGIAEGGAGPEIWLRDETSGVARTVSIGETIGGAELIAIEGDEAEFTLDDNRFRVRVGEHLSDRRLVRN